MTRITRPLVRAAAALGVATAVLALAGPAWAHVDAEGQTSTAGITTVTFHFEHGCVDSPTTSLKVKLPDGTTDVTAQNPTGWTSTTDGGQIQWTGGSIPADQPGTFVAAMRLAGTTGDTVYLPTIQGCAAGENTWIELTPDPEADDAAPRIVLTETVAPGSTTTVAQSPTSGSTGTTVDAAAAARDAQIVKESENSPIGAIVIVIVVAIIVGGGVILYLRNRRPSAS